MDAKQGGQQTFETDARPCRLSTMPTSLQATTSSALVTKLQVSHVALDNVWSLYHGWNCVQDVDIPGRCRDGDAV